MCVFIIDDIKVRMYIYAPDLQKGLTHAIINIKIKCCVSRECMVCDFYAILNLWLYKVHMYVAKFN